MSAGTMLPRGSAEFVAAVKSGKLTAVEGV
jgi:hypothetical protein